MEWTADHQYTEDIRRLRALLNGETIEGLKCGDPGLDYAWIERKLITREEQLQRLRATPPKHEATIANTPYEGKRTPVFPDADTMDRTRTKTRATIRLNLRLHDRTDDAVVTLQPFAVKAHKFGRLCPWEYNG